ncbi:MAG: PAS domain S-box protein [Pseudomonadota bacterium]
MVLKPGYIELEQRIKALEKELLERNRLEETCREDRETYQDLFDKANDLIQSVSPDGRFIQVNRSWQETLGYTEKELANLTLWDVIHPASRAHCEEILKKVLSGETANRIEVVFVSKNGTPVPVEGSINCRFEGKKAVATRGFFRDITKRKLVEQRLLKAHKQLKETNKKLELAYAKMRE